MKERVITAFVLIVILVPIFIIEELFPVFYGVMILMTAIGAFEMLLMFNEEETMNPFIMIATILSTVFFYLSLVFSSNQPFLQGYEFYIFNLDFNITLLVIGFLLLTMIIFSPKNSMKTIAHSFTTIFYVGLGFGSLTILRMMGIRFLIFLIYNYCHNRYVCVFLWR